MDDTYKIVDFEQYCKTCKHEKAKEDEEPCAECLSEPARPFSRKPLKWEGRK